jgi:hypothetical protein
MNPKSRLPSPAFSLEGAASSPGRVRSAPSASQAPSPGRGSPARTRASASRVAGDDLRVGSPRADVFPRSRKRHGLHRTDSTRRSSSSTIAGVLPVVLTRIRRATSHEPPLLYFATLPGRDLPRALAQLRCCECTIPPVGYINEAAHRSGGGLRPPNPFSHRTIFSGSWDDPGTAPDRPRQRLQAREGPAHGTRSERTASGRPT